MADHPPESMRGSVMTTRRGRPRRRRHFHLEPLEDRIALNNPLDVLESAAPPEQVDQAFSVRKARRRRRAGDDFDAQAALLGSLPSAGAPVEAVGAATSASALGTSSRSTATR